MPVVDDFKADCALVTEGAGVEGEGVGGTVGIAEGTGDGGLIGALVGSLV